MIPLAPDWDFATPPQLAFLLGTNNGKIIEFISTGELKAINVASAGTSRPRFRVARKEWERFLESRVLQPQQAPVKPGRLSRDNHSRRRKQRA